MMSFSAVAACLLSFAIFTHLNNFLDCDESIPKPPKFDASRRQKWRNSIGSVVHATVVAVLSFLSLPDLWWDVVNSYNVLGEITMAIVTGYIIYDTMDLIVNRSIKVIWPLIIHHLIAGGYAAMFIWNQKYLAFGILCGTVELNSIFLHSRQLLIMYGFDKQSRLFHVNNVINILTFVAVRIPAFIIIIIFSIGERDRMENPWSTAIVLGTLGLLIVNLGLFKRLIVSDFFSNHKSKTANGTTESEEDIMLSQGM